MGNLILAVPSGQPQAARHGGLEWRVFCTPLPQAAAGELLVPWHVFPWKWNGCHGWRLRHVEGKRRKTAPCLATVAGKVNCGACTRSAHF